MEFSSKSSSDVSGTSVKDFQNFDFEMQITKSKAQTKKTMQDDVEIDKYMSLVETELKKIGHSLNQGTFMENIINILDKLIAVNILI
jgi:hypothetical protein